MSEQDTIAVAVSKMVDAVNRGDFGEVVGAFVAAPTIVEDIAPFRWQGPAAASAWLAAMGANAARLNIRAIIMELGRCARIAVSGAAAYAIFAGTLILTTAEGDLVSSGDLTLTLEKDGDLWLIETLIWSGPEPARG